MYECVLPSKVFKVPASSAYIYKIIEAPPEDYKTLCLQSVFGSMREKDGFSGCSRVSGGYDFAGSGVSGCSGRVESLGRAVFDHCWWVG